MVKVLVLGAGAVGGYFFGKLHEYRQQQQRQQKQNPGGDCAVEEDVEVTFLVRSGRAAQLESDGLILHDIHSGTKHTIQNVPYLTNGTTTTTTTTSSISAKPAPMFDVIVLTCKSYGLEGALDAIAPYVHQDVAILPLLNGMDHLQTIAGRFPNSVVWGGTCGIVASLNPDSGIITKQTASSWVRFGLQTNDSDDTDESSTLSRHLCQMDILANVWQLAGLEAEHIRGGKIQQAMWNKWIFLASLGASNCLLQGTMGQVVNTDHGEALVTAMIKECEDIAEAEQRSNDAADGVDNGDSSNTKESTALTFQMIKKNFLHPTSPFKTSMARDMDQGFPTEADHLVGDLIRRAQKHKIATPLLCASYTRLQIYETTRSSNTE
jgi:2-dehydropantoate 2-reductase